MILRRIVLLAFLWFSLSSALLSQTISFRDSKISKMINEISQVNLKNNVTKLVNFGTRHSLSADEKEKGLFAACRWVKEEFDKIALSSGGSFEAVWDTFTVKPDGRRIKNSISMVNVLGKLKGNSPSDNRVFIVSGHIDSRNGNANDAQGTAPGANDDASGVSLVMELAKIMAKRNFPATIIFAVVCGEEQGLYGSSHLADMAKKSNWNVTVMLNNDMVGNSQSSGTGLNDNIRFRVFSETLPAFETDEMKSMRQTMSGENDSRSRQLARYVKEVGEEYVENVEVKLIYRNDRFLRGGDHTPFLKNGFTAVRFCEMNENYDRQHQNVKEENGKKFGDLIEFVDFEYVRKIAAVNLAVLAEAAYAPLSPEKVFLETRELGNDTKLKWTVSTGSKPAGFNILIRETSSPVWEKKIYTTGTEAVIPYSKDNYFFAVQSCDDKGHRSIPVFPQVQR